MLVVVVIDKPLRSVVLEESERLTELVQIDVCHTVPLTGREFGPFFLFR